MSARSSCSCCSPTSNHSNPTSPNISECSISNIQDYSLFPSSTINQIEDTAGGFTYQYPIDHSQHHYNHYNAFDQNYMVSDNWLTGTAPESNFLSPPVYYESYFYYNMAYPSSERFLGTSEYIPVYRNHGYYQSFTQEVTPTAYNQMNHHLINYGYPLLANSIKLENTEDNSTEVEGIPSCNRPTRTRNIRKTGVMQLQCSVCFKTFTRPYNLKSHIKIHTKERPYICQYEECKWTFARPHDLKRHQLLHLGIKPYKCVCEKGFSRSDAYKRHLKTNPECSLITAFLSNN